MNEKLWYIVVVAVQFFTLHSITYLDTNHFSGNIMIPDLYKDIKIQLYERATSPLLGSFVISWCLWNYKMILVIFSSAKALDKIKHINDRLYPEYWDVLSFGIVFPLITTLAFIFLYPIPALYIFEYTRKQQAKLKEVQQKIEDETPLLEKEAREIRSNLRSIVQRHDEEIKEKDKDIADRDASISQLNSSLDTAAKKKGEIETELLKANEGLSRLQSQNRKPGKKKSETNDGQKESNSNDKLDWQTSLGKLTITPQANIEKNTNLMAIILKKLGAKGSKKDIIVNQIGGDSTIVLYIIDQLKNIGFIDENSYKDIHITDTGRKFLVEVIQGQYKIKPTGSAPPQQL